MNIGLLSINNYSCNYSKRVAFKGDNNSSFDEIKIIPVKKDSFEPDYYNMNTAPFWEHLERIEEIDDSGTVKLKSGYPNCN